jgi:hypothetical protein
MRSKSLLGIGVVAMVSLLSAAAPGGQAATVAASSCPLPQFGPGAQYHPRIDPKSFTANITNPWYPLRIGTTFLYTGVDEGDPAVDIVVVTHHTRVIDGVRTRVVADRLVESGHVVERTLDYFAQDACGNVWYFGEDTAELDARGHVTSTDGTWHSGIDGAEPGVFMQANPELNRRFRQEWYQGAAEDTFVARDLSTPVTVRAGSFLHALRTEETTALEPGILDNKWYVKGIGEVEEVTIKGPQERFVLVEVIG